MFALSKHLLSNANWCCLYVYICCTRAVHVLYMCSPFGQPAPNGDCGWWNGVAADRSDMSASLVPADMVAALSTSMSDYPGSCGRYYDTCTPHALQQQLWLSHT